MSLQHTDLLLADTESDTGPLDVSDQVIVAIHFPAEWDGTEVTLSASVTVDGDYLVCADAAGADLVVTAAADRIVAIAPDATRGLRYVKLTSDAAQTEDCVLVVATLPDDRA